MSAKKAPRDAPEPRGEAGGTPSTTMGIPPRIFGALKTLAEVEWTGTAGLKFKSGSIVSLVVPREYKA